MAELLIIEDDPQLLKVLREAVELNGDQVQVAANGEQGLALLKGGYQPSAILCDIALPHMNGLELLRQVRLNAAWMSVRFVAMSGSDDLRGEALAYGADDYLVKPFKFRDLFEVLARENPAE